jgi:hypothetical protein
VGLFSNDKAEPVAVKKTAAKKSRRNPDPMKVLDFSSELISSQDLDPIYNMLYASGMPMATKKRWVLAYSCYYHAGVASYCAEDRSKFYKRLREGHDKKFPRGAERRHFRGGTSDYVTSWLKKTYPVPEEAVNYLIGDEPDPTFKSVTDRVKTWKYYGPWIAFKWADLLERVIQVPVDFSDCHLDIYEAPKQGAELVALSLGKPDMSVKQVVRYLEKKLSGFNAPPDNVRAVNVQEIETCLCKWKSHCNGHYPIGKDTHEIGEGLEGWGDLASHLKAYLPTMPPQHRIESHVKSRQSSKSEQSDRGRSRSLWVDHR